MASSFFDALSKFDGDFRSLDNKEKELSEIRLKLENRLNKILTQDITSLQSEKSSMHQLSSMFLSTIASSIRAWNEEFQAMSPMKALSEQYSDKVIFLVFGKVNAGKSSFCNFISEQFAANQQNIQRFYVENGKAIQTQENFVEGVTETTARIQGVELGGRCVLLDSPGLHSVTEANEAITRAYTDSADAVLWLTPSTSPGQVQELFDLKSEIEKKKPVLPVITRSDEVEEDEIDGQIVAVLKNKTTQRRLGQEEDVRKRLKDGGFDSVAKPPISISVHAHKKASSSLEESGLSKLFEELIVIVDEARIYKGKKATQQMINYLDGNVKKSLTEKVGPALTSLIQESKKQRKALSSQKNRMSDRLTYIVSAEIPFIVKRHTQFRDKNAVAEEVEQLVTSEVNGLLAEMLKDYVSKFKEVHISFDKEMINDFDDKIIRFMQNSGAKSKSVSRSVSAAVGGAIGWIFGPVGGMIGVLIGGVIGNKAGEYFEETTECEEVVGTSTDKIIASLNEEIKKLAPKLVADGINVVSEMLTQIDNAISDVQSALDDFSKELDKVKVAL